MAGSARHIVRRMLIESQREPVRIRVSRNRGPTPTLVYPMSSPGEIPESWPPVEAFLEKHFKTRPYVHSPALWVNAPTQEVYRALESEGFPVENEE